MEDPLAKAWIVDDTQYLIILNINLYGNRILNIVTNRNSWNSILLIADFILCPLSCRWPANKNDVCLLGSLKLEYPSKGFSSKRHRSETKDLIIKTPCSKALLLDDHMGLYYLICNWGYGSVWEIDQNRVRRNIQWFIIILNWKLGGPIFRHINIIQSMMEILKKNQASPWSEPGTGTGNCRNCRNRSRKRKSVLIHFPWHTALLRIIYVENWSGWWLGHPSEKYEGQLGWLFPIYGNIENVPNHQPVML